jgi:O-antigen/teichoic acid export membrane protein
MDVIRLRLSAWLGSSAMARLVKNTSLLLSAEALVSVIGFARFLLITHALDNDYGVWMLVSSAVAVISQIIAVRLWETVIKYVSEFMVAGDEARLLALIKLCLLIDLVVAVLVFAAVAVSANWLSLVFLKRPDLGALFLAEAARICVKAGLSVWMALLRVFDRFKWLSLNNVLTSVAWLVLSLVVLELGLGVAGLIVAGVIINAAQTIMLLVLTGRELRARFRGHWLTANLTALRGRGREIGGMLFSMNVDSFRKIILNGADTLVLGYFTTAAEVTVYEYAMQLTAYLARLTQPIYDSLYPEVARLYAAEGPVPVRALVRKLTIGLTAIFGGLLAGTYLFSWWLIPAIFPKYAPAIPIFLITVLTNLWIIGLWAPSLMVAAGRARQFTVYNTISALVMLIMLLVLTPLWGSVGTAIATVGYYVAWMFTVYPAALKILARPSQASGG